MSKLINNFAFRTTITYIIIGGLWISSSDWILGLLVTDPKIITVISLSKGWVFIAVTSIILYFQLARELKFREKYDSEIRQLNSELEEKVKNRTIELQAAIQELEAFSYTVSHDLRAPLRRIDGFDRILQEDYASHFDKNGITTLQRIHEASQQMSKLIDALLQLSKVNRIELSLSEVNLSRMAKEIIAEMYSERQNVDWEITEGLILHADPTLMHIVLVNLLGNAYKYTRTQSHAVIQMGKIEQEGRYWYFVRDNGVGFDMAYAEHIFEAFHRLNNEFEGTGIGLASVKRIIHRHQGEIKVEAAVDKGAAFYFYV